MKEIIRGIGSVNHDHTVVTNRPYSSIKCVYVCFFRVFRWVSSGHQVHDRANERIWKTFTQYKHKIWHCI